MNHPIVSAVESATRNNPIDVSFVIKLAETGLEQYTSEDRFYGWLILLGLFTSDVESWQECVMKMRSCYNTCMNRYKINNWHTVSDTKTEQIDEPEVMDMIHRDLTRTVRALVFFPQKMIEGATNIDNSVVYNVQEHVRRIERSVYIFLKTNPEYSYLQCFNELILPFYFVALKTTNDLDLCECLAFHCFKKLLGDTQITRFFSAQRELVDVTKSYEEFLRLEKKYASDAFHKLEKLKIHPLYYAMRWFSVLFSHEYDLPNLLIVWDVLLSHMANFTEYLSYMAIAHIKMIENRLGDDYSRTLNLLHNMELEGAIEEVISTANTLWKQNHGLVSRMLSRVSKWMDYL